MSGTASDILSFIAPQFNTTTNRADFIQLATERTNVCYFGTNANQAIALRAAHILTLSATRPLGEVGSISSKSEGSLSLSYGGAGSSGDADLNSTYYGVQLQSLRKASQAFLGVTGGLDQGCHVNEF